MENIFNYPLNFSIEFGKGYISYDELQNLEIDQCFIINKNAGEGFFLKVNNEIICSGEMVVIYDYFGFRISNIYNKSQSNELSSHINTIEELLPFEIRFDDFHATIEDLKGISDGSIIYLDKLYDENIDAKMLVFGIPIAEGKTITVKENLGIHIKKCLIKTNDNKKQTIIRNSGNRYIYKTNKNLIKYYNFKKPDKVTWVFLKKFELLHQSFVNNLSQTINTYFENINVIADQMTITEYISEIKEDNYTYYIYKMFFPRTVNPDKKTVEYKLFFESKYIKNKLSLDRKEKLRSFVDKRVCEPKMVICLNNNSLVNKIKNEITEIFLNTLQNTWLQITNTQILYDKKVNSKKDIEIVPPNDMILTVTISDKDNEILKMIYPFITIEPIFQVLK